MPISEVQLLAEVEDVLRTMPLRDEFASRNENVRLWLGRAAAVIEIWDLSKGLRCTFAVDKILMGQLFEVHWAVSTLSTLLHQARTSLLLNVGRTSVVVQQGQVFDYFDDIRKLIETARSDVLFVDPYLDAEFVSRYLPSVAKGVDVRLLGRERMASLLPAVDMFVKQYNATVQVRSSNGLHDRYLFVDKSSCYLSGASFKDGAKNAPATVAQIMDAFQAMWDTYETLWNGGTVER